MIGALEALANLLKPVATQALLAHERLGSRVACKPVSTAPPGPSLHAQIMVRTYLQ